LTPIDLVLLVIVVAVFLTAAIFFAYAESATIAAERVILHHAAREGNKRAQLVESFYENPRRFFGTTLIGTNICIVIISSVTANSILPSLKIPIALSTFLVDLLILIFAEISPKILSLANPTVSSMTAAPILDVLARLMSPIVWVLTLLPSRIVDIDNIFHRDGGKLITESQLVHMIGVGALQGSIGASEGKRAVNVFKFGDTTVERVMVSQVDMVSLTVGDSVRKALAVANATGFSRIPVVTADGGDSPGFISVKDILLLFQQNRLDEPVEKHLRPISFIPESKRILELLDEFRKGSEQIALVIDEFGAIVGLVTLEDLLEEILGEIYDEYDRDAPVTHWMDGSLLIPGSYPATKLADVLKVKLPDGDFDTSAGLFLYLAGGIPLPGQSVSLDDKWELTATHLLRHRITKLAARKKQPLKPV
jgi:putative hemolysin